MRKALEKAGISGRSDNFNLVLDEFDLRSRPRAVARSQGLLSTVAARCIDGFLAPIDQRVGFSWGKRRDLGVVGEGKTLAPARGATPTVTSTARAYTQSLCAPFNRRAGAPVSRLIRPLD